MNPLLVLEAACIVGFLVVFSGWLVVTKPMSSRGPYAEQAHYVGPERRGR